MSHLGGNSLEAFRDPGDRDVIVQGIPFDEVLLADSLVGLYGM